MDLFIHIFQLVKIILKYFLWLPNQKSNITTLKVILVIYILYTCYIYIYIYIMLNILLLYILYILYIIYYVYTYIYLNNLYTIYDIYIIYIYIYDMIFDVFLRVMPNFLDHVQKWRTIVVNEEWALHGFN